MVNVAVFNLKDLGKYLLRFLALVLLIMLVTKGYHYLEQKSFTVSLDKTIPAMQYMGKEEGASIDFGEQEELKTSSFIEYILNTQLAMNKHIVAKLPEQTEDIEVEQEVEETISEDVDTKVVQDNNIQTTYTNKYKSVEIKNSSKYALTDEILTPDIELTNKRNILIFHTHTCESYTPSERFSYTMTGSYRTTDLNYSVSRVGDELENYLSKCGYQVTHDKTINDYPAYTGSYNRSLEAVNKDLETQKDTEIVFDLHRDAVGSKNDYAPTVKIGDEYAAQIMFVIGTDGGGLTHPNWQQNLKFAIKVQEKANELYPGLFRPIILRNSRYNQHVTKAATIIEVGATGNTLEQCLTSMKYFSHILDEVLKE